MATAAATAQPKFIAMENWRPRANPWVIAATVAMAAFMEVLDTSIANVALPHIAGSLGASQDESTWVLTAYLVSNAVVLPMGGWVASIIGRKRFFMSCIVIFTISSFLCGSAPSLPLLLLFRVIQGAGGGGLQPMAQAIMADSFEPAKRGLAFALYGIVAVLAPSIGPTLGGWITDNYSWNWIFYINIPVGILTLILTNRLVEDPPWNVPDRKNFFKLDYVGVSLLVISMGALQIMLDKGEENDWFGSHFIVTCAVTFVASFIALIAWEWFAKAPLMDLKLFKNRNFAVCCFLMLLTGGFLNATTVLLPQYLQSALGYTATWAGLALSGGCTRAASRGADYRTTRHAFSCAQHHRLWVLLLHGLILCYGEPAESRAEFRRVFVAAHPAGVRDSCRVYLGDDGGIFWNAARQEQPGGGPDQFRAQHRRQHSDLADQRCGGGAVAVPPEPASEVPDAHQRQYAAADPVAEQCLRPHRRTRQRRQLCTGKDL